MTSFTARALSRAVIQEHVKKPLADEILFGKLVRGGHVKVVLVDGKIAFEIDSNTRETRPGEIDIHPDTDLSDEGGSDESEGSGEPALVE